MILNKILRFFVLYSMCFVKFSKICYGYELVIISRMRSNVPILRVLCSFEKAHAEPWNPPGRFGGHNLVQIYRKWLQGSSLV